MTCKHFQALAAMLKQSRPDNPVDRIRWYALCNQLADFCRSQNARFDYDKFLQACGAKE